MDLPAVAEESELVEFVEGGRVFQLHPDALRAWRLMRLEAKRDGVVLSLVSAFRSVARQEEIIERKRERGLSDDEIFRVNAPAGFSEHHSGRAIDLTTDGFRALEEAFETSDAFEWLVRRAGEFGFRLSYPRNNEYGIAYEPWHWFYGPRMLLFVSD